MVPQSEMIDHLGNRVISGNRCENHFGHTPGGCFDHPGVWNRMKSFLTETVGRYALAPNLAGWDAWNELRWKYHSENLVCFCPHTLSKFRAWLDAKYTGLDNLNRAWMRRYNSFEEILPGKQPDRTYTEMMAWQHFMTWRSDEHGKDRYRVMKALDPAHDVTAHAATPSPLFVGADRGTSTPEYALERGNDWALAETLDGIGCSSFPKWFGIDDAGFGMRVEFVKSAARGKKVWLSEIQGGRSAIGFKIFEPVDAASQQRWIWNGIACGADKLLFWCWRDEVFGRESAGFGLTGLDGLAGERLAALKKTREVLDRHSALFSHYRPSENAEAGILFSPQTHYLAWSQEGNSLRPVNAAAGYARALVRLCIPYTVVEETRLDAIKNLKILFLPRLLVTDEKYESALMDFVRNGGTLVCESECGAFSPQGFYRYPDERFIPDLIGAAEAGRRPLSGEPVAGRIAGRAFGLQPFQWLTPMRGGAPVVVAKHPDGALIAEYKSGQGKVVVLGSYFGEAYHEAWNRDFEVFLDALCRQAGVRPEIEVVAPGPKESAFVYVKAGESQGRKVVFVFFPEKAKKAELLFKANYFKGEKMRDLFSDKPVSLKKSKKEQALVVNCPQLKVAVLAEE
jgi:beta-galactosidase